MKHLLFTAIVAWLAYMGVLIVAYEVQHGDMTLIGECLFGGSIFGMFAAFAGLAWLGIYHSWGLA